MSWNDIPGWTCHRLRELYDELAPTGGTFVEIGVAYGASLAYMASRSHRFDKLFGVDIWESHQGHGQLSDEVWQRVTSRSPMASCIAELDRSSVDMSKITLIRKTGVEAAADFDDTSVNVIFIDEHHTLESVSTCIEAWLPKMKPGGIMSGHDCNPHYPGVLQAVEKCLTGAEVRPPHENDGGWGGVWKWVKP